MDDSTARDYLALGEWEIAQKQTGWTRRQDYYEGRQDLPFAPEGVNAEYESLREQSVANWLALAMDTPTQRLRVEGFRTGRKGAADEQAWERIWQPNKLDARQRIVYSQMMVHARGLVSVWPNGATPVIRPENGRRVHLQMDPADPFTPAWAVKVYTQRQRPDGLLWTPPGTSSSAVKSVAVVYDGDSWMRFERAGMVPGTAPTAWEKTAEGFHALGVPPFVPFDLNQDADGVPHSALTPLMPAQDAINTIRFNALLAMQFSAFRQRVFTNYDPVVRDDQGKVVWQKNDDGSVKTDANGQPKPLLAQQGRIGVDRALAFPGDTKVFDLPESNLDNYIKVLGEFLTQFFAVAQIPPQYLLSRMANLSGDALAGAESTLASLVADLQTSVGEGWEQVMRLANRAAGEDATDVASEVIWSDAEARSFAQAIDAITKLIAAGFPHEAAFELIPGATPQKVSRWMDMRDAEATDPLLERALRPVADGAAAGAGVAGGSNGNGPSLGG